MEEKSPPSPIEKAGKKALETAKRGPVEFRLLRRIADEEGVPFQRLLSFLDLAGQCNVNHDAKQVTCPKE